MSRPRKKGERYPSGELRPQADHGTAERWQKGGMELDETMEAGTRRARVKHECLLDVLHDAGDLGAGAAGNRRYDAGLWLRALYLRTHSEGITWEMEPVQGRSEMSDELAAAHRRYQRAMLAVGWGFDNLRKVCCHDMPGDRSSLVNALDRLADWRGMT